MISLEERVRRDEQMDDPGLDPALYERILRDLSQVNSVTMGRRPTLAFLRRGAAGMPAFRLLDVGFGYGDMLRAISRWARRRGIAVDLVGVDLNPRSAPIATGATRAGMPIEYRTGDYDKLAGQGWDFVISSAVTHHMSDEQILGFLRFMESEAARGWIVNDILRHRFAYYGFPLLARILGWHRIVREDGQLSIARGFRPDEWRGLLAAAGIPEGAARVVRRFPFRLCVERLR